MPRVKFLPHNITVEVQTKTRILEVARDNGIDIYTPCGGHARCGKCYVKVIDGMDPPSRVEKNLLPPDKLRDGFRLSCFAVIKGDVTVEVPPPFDDLTFLFDENLDLDLVIKNIDPPIYKIHLRVGTKTLNDEESYEKRILRNLKKHFEDQGFDRSPESIVIDKIAGQQLPSAISSKNGSITLSIHNDHIIDVASGDNTKYLYGAAFDIGTTTVVGFLMDMYSGKIITAKGALNPQQNYGADVLNRARYIMENTKGLEELSSAIHGCINTLLAQLAEEVNIAPSEIMHISVAGNTIMQHIFLNISPESIAMAPFTPMITEGHEIPVSKLNLRINPGAYCYILPSIAGYVGGDIVAGLLVTELNKTHRTILFLDIGTNGEIALVHKNKLYACASPAGPTFEGSQIKQGMRAEKGAIERVSLVDGIEISIIGGSIAKGICGSGMIDMIAELFKTGIIDESGRFQDPELLKTSLLPDVYKAIEKSDEGYQFRIAPDVVVTQRDVREIQLAKGAIRGGIKTIMKEAGTEIGDLDKILIAGAFGNFIDVYNALTLNIIPNIPVDRIKFIGNTSGAGARICLLNKDLRNAAQEIADMTRYIELSGRPDFQETFTDSLFFGREVQV